MFVPRVVLPVYEEVGRWHLLDNFYFCTFHVIYLGDEDRMIINVIISLRFDS